MSNSSTNPPYANATTSSTAATPQQYIGIPVQTPTQNSESRFNVSDWALMLAGMVITGLIGYFSSLIAVKSDIAENSKNISVMKEKVSHIDSELSSIKDDLKFLNKVTRETDILSVRLGNLEKYVEKQDLQVTSKSSITK